MAVPVDARLWKFKVGCLITARLFKVADGAVIIGHMIRRLRCNKKDGLACQIRELSWRGTGSLEYTLGMVHVRRRILLLHEIHRGIVNRGSVGERDVSQSPSTSGSGAEDGFLERRSRRFQQDEGLCELRTSISNDNWHQATLAMANKNHGLSNLVQQRRTGSLHCELLIRGVVDELDIGAVEGVKDGIAHGAIAWPLRMKNSLWPQVVILRGGEALLNNLGGISRRLNHHVSRLPWGACSKRLVYEVYLVTLV